MKPRIWGLALCTVLALGAVSPVLGQGISVTVEVSPTRLFAPLQSYGSGHTSTADLFFGGLTDMGLHVFGAGAFPRRNFNQSVFLVDLQTGGLLSGYITHLAPELQEALIMTAPADVQFGDTLYLYGGYGPAIIQPDYTTRTTVTAIDLPMVEAAIRSAQPIPAAAFTVSASKLVRVSGAGIVKFSDGNRFALICGADADGDYANMGDPSYTDEVRIFDRTVSMTNPVQVFNDGLSFSSPMHRRDVNTLGVTLPDKQGGTRDGFVVVAGAFEHGVFIHDNPIIWGEGDTAVIEDDLFIQHLGGYEGPTVSLYSVANNTNHILTMSGLSGHEPDGAGGFLWNPASPWTDAIGHMTIVDGVFTNEVIAGQMPWPSTNAHFITDPSMPVNALGQIMVDDLPTGIPVLIGHVYGGTAAEMTGDTSPTYASESVLEVSITVERAPGTFASMDDYSMVLGVLLSGGMAEISVSDDQYLHTASQFGFSAREPNVTEVQYRFTNPLGSPVTLDLYEEARLNNPGGTAVMQLRNYTTKTFDTVATYPIGLAESVVQTMNINASDYVKPKNQRINMRVRHAVIATFSAAGFQSFIDFAGVEVRD